MLLSMGPLQSGQLCSAVANSSLTHALHSEFLHFKILVGNNFGFVSSLVVISITSLSYLRSHQNADKIYH